MIARIARNTLFLSTSQIIARAIGFFYIIFLARVFDVSTFGLYSFVLAFVYNFVPVADFGLERFVLRDISRKPEEIESYLSRLLPLRSLVALVAFLLLSGSIVIFASSAKEALFVLLFGLSLFPHSLIMFFSSFTNALEKMEYLSGAVISVAALNAILGSALALAGKPLWTILLAGVLANVLVLLTFLTQIKKMGWTIKPKVDSKFWKKALSESWPFAAILILAVFYLRSSIVLVNFLKGSYFTGLYAPAFKFVEAAILFPQAAALALFPTTSRLLASDKEALFRVYQKALLGLFLLSLPFVASFYFLASFIIKIAYGAPYLPAVGPFKIMGISLMLFFLNSLPGNVIQSSPKVKDFLPFAFLNFLVMIGLCFYLIPRLGISGAALAVLFSEVFGFVINNFYVWKILKS